MMCFSVPPGYQRTADIKRPKLDGFTGFVDQWLQEDLSRNRKQRHTAKRIFERLRDEHGFNGGYTTVKNYVREHGRRSREMFVPLTHAPGHAQADFGAAMVVIGGVELKAYFFALDLPHSDACFVRARCLMLLCLSRSGFKQVVRRFHAASLISGSLISFSGLSQTGPVGCQLRILPDQRPGFCARAFA